MRNDTKKGPIDPNLPDYAYTCSHLMVGLALAALVGSLSGCKGPAQGSADKGPLAIMQEQAAAINASGGFAAVGTGESPTLTLALDKAKTQAGTELAHLVENRLDSLKRDFLGEVGAEHTAEYDAFLAGAMTSATEGYTGFWAAGRPPRDLKYVTERSRTTAWALRVGHPKIIANAFANQANSQRAIYTRFRSSRAFKALEDQIRRFEEYEEKNPTEK